MGQMLQCVSPIDGSVFAERAVMSKDAAFESVGRARAAQVPNGRRDRCRNGLIW